MGAELEDDLLLDLEEFGARLDQQLELLAETLETPGFGCKEPSIGVELEASLIDDHGRACCVGPEIVASANDSRVTVELDRFNVEYNLDPLPLSGSSLSRLEQELRRANAQLAEVAAEHGARVVHAGVLPTLKLEDIGRDAMTDTARFRILNRALCELRGEAFQIDIDGPEPLHLRMQDVLLEGANTSLQVHLCVEPDAFADVYNAAQIATPIALGISTNSPTVFGHKLWKESRVALFKQSVDTRRVRDTDWSRPPRVTFGDGWVRRGAFEIFAESVALYPSLLPVIEDHPPDAKASGGAPRLTELRLHNGTVWRWNRAVYDPIDGGHLRVEMRALPSGPTPLDMVANAAFLVGMTLGLRERVPELLAALPFSYAQYNFYRAAQHGLDASLIWPSKRKRSPETVPLRELAERMLKTAEQGLQSVGVDAEDIARVLSVIQGRIAANITGADWQLRHIAALEERPLGRDDAMHQMLDRYLLNIASGKPVHEWDLT